MFFGKNLHIVNPILLAHIHSASRFIY